METKQEREARLRRMADIGRAYIVRYPETGEGKPIPPSKPWLYAPKPAECGKCQADGTVNLVRINLSPGDGWQCIRCGWAVYDPERDQCLDCPLPRCVEEMTAAERAALAARHREKWDAERVRVILEEGLSVEDAAERFSITPRTVWRILARTRKAGSRRENNSG